MMKKVKVLLFALVSMYTLTFASCEKNNVDPVNTGTDPVNTGKVIPDEAVGEWQYGSASMTEIWDNSTNSYLGNAFELSIRFNLKKNGTYEQYFVAGSKMLGGCMINVFNIESGTITFDAASKTFTTTPQKVKNKYYNCGVVSNSETTTGLKSNTYKWQKTTASSGTPVLEIKPSDSENFATFYKK